MTTRKKMTQGFSEERVAIISLNSLTGGELKGDRLLYSLYYFPLFFYLQNL
jgi:hypothetical protein